LSELANYAAEISRNGGQPLYMQVTDHLRRQLISGVWRTDDNIPPINELASAFGVARVTIREAVKVLCDEGLLTAERGRGTKVTGRARGQRALKLETTLSALVASLQNDRPDLSNLAEGRQMPPAGETKGTPARAYHYIKRVHLRDDLRYCVIDLYLDTAIFEQAPMRFQVGLALPVLADLASEQIVSATQNIRFGKCSAEVSEQLRYPMGDPVAHIAREITDAQGRVIYFANVTYRADILEIGMALR